MWPKGFRKKKPYTADELRVGDCVRDAEKIKKARGSGELAHILPSDPAFCLGPVHPPSGGVIDEWLSHCAVQDGNRFYDKMTGPNGMTNEDYAGLFQNWDQITIVMEMEEEDE